METLTKYFVSVFAVAAVIASQIWAEGPDFIDKNESIESALVGRHIVLKQDIETPSYQTQYTIQNNRLVQSFVDFSHAIPYCNLKIERRSKDGILKSGTIYHVSKSEHIAEEMQWVIGGGEVPIRLTLVGPGGKSSKLDCFVPSQEFAMTYGLFVDSMGDYLETADLNELTTR